MAVMGLSGGGAAPRSPPTDFGLLRLYRLSPSAGERPWSPLLGSLSAASATDRQSADRQRPGASL